MIATLHGVRDYGTPFQPWCVTCGDRDAADVLLNLMLFMPFGAALAMWSVRPLQALGIGALLSFSMEAAQIFVPGRDPNVRDLVMNTIGTGAGLFIIRQVHRSVSAPAPPWAPLITTGGAGVIIVLFSLLLQPSFSDAQYYGMWTQERLWGETYRGHILAARLADVPIPSAPLEHSETIKRLLDSGAPVEVELVAGPQVRRRAPIFAITDTRVDAINIWAERNDLVLHYRSRSAAFHLDQPDVRLRGVMPSLHAGDTVTIRASHQPNTGWCVAVAHQEECGLGFTIASGWRVLYSGFSSRRRLSAITDLGWIAFLTFPVGMWWRRSWAAVTGSVGLGLAMAIVPIATGLLPTRPDQWLAAAAGILGGWLAAAFLRVVVQPGPLPKVAS